MARNNRLRFPYRAYERRLTWLIEEMRQWREQYRIRANVVDTGVIHLALVARAEGVDEIWHLLYAAKQELLNLVYAPLPPHSDSLTSDEPQHEQLQQGNQ